MGVSVRVIGIWLGLQISKSDDNRVNANWEIFQCFMKRLVFLCVRFVLFDLPLFF
jgi:hypothetical protein